jgi:hypothetical protein
MNDDQMDELLREGVRDYNEPGHVPREEMWSRIQAARIQRVDSLSAGAAPTRRGLWVWPSMGVAAALLVTAGIVIGRRMERSSSASVPVPVAQTAANTGANTGANTATANVAHDTTAATPVAHEQTVVASTAAARGVQVGGTAHGSGGSLGPTQADVPNLAYRLVVLQHLAGTEAMITTFRAAAEKGQTDTLVAGWSRQLLGTTRMLAASPAADDPVMKRLLQDLDFVITEIVQYSAHGVNNPEELKLIEQSINERSVIPKLRGTIPSRVPLAGT